jgi:hypothetical protein
MRSSAILLAGDNRVDAAFALAAEAESPTIFLMHTGVRALADPRLGPLVDAGVDVIACAMDAEAHGQPAPGGVRLGSQYDHAVLARDATRFVALTPRGAMDFRAGAGPRTVRVLIGCDPRAPEVGQALRSAVAYAGLGLGVTVAVEPEARALLEHLDHPPAVLRALATLRGLGHPVTHAEKTARAHIEVRW